MHIYKQRSNNSTKYKLSGLTHSTNSIVKIPAGKEIEGSNIFVFYWTPWWYTIDRYCNKIGKSLYEWSYVSYLFPMTLDYQR